MMMDEVDGCHPSPHEAFFCFFFITDKKDLESPFVPCRILKHAHGEI
jgi:hypothetical protein